MENTKALDQELFDRIIQIGTDMGYRVHPALPDAKALYPFIVPGEIQVMRKTTSSGAFGKVFVTIDIWGEKGHRKDVSLMADRMEGALNMVTLSTRRMSLDRTPGANHMRLFRESNTSSLVNGSLPYTLWHAVLELQFNIHL